MPLDDDYLAEAEARLSEALACVRSVRVWLVSENARSRREMGLRHMPGLIRHAYWSASSDAAAAAYHITNAWRDE